MDLLDPVYVYVENQNGIFFLLKICVSSNFNMNLLAWTGFFQLIISDSLPYIPKVFDKISLWWCCSVLVKMRLPWVNILCELGFGG